jgi:hypothetical protein
MLLPGPRALRQHWDQHRFDYLNLAIELPALLPEAISRLREGPTRPPPPAANPPRRWPSLSGAFAAGVGVAMLARRHRRSS